MWNLKRNDTNELIKQKEAHRLRNKLNSCQGEGIVCEFGKVMYTALYLKWITNKDLELHSMLCASLDGSGVCGSIYMCGWVPSLFTWNYYNTVNQLYHNTKCFRCWKKKKEFSRGQNFFNLERAIQRREKIPGWSACYGSWTGKQDFQHQVRCGLGRLWSPQLSLKSPRAFLFAFRSFSLAARGKY